MGRRSFKEWVNSPRVAAVVFVCVAVLFGLFAVNAYDEATVLRARGLVTEATVLEVHDRLKAESFVVVRFETADGRRVTANVEHYYWRPRPQVGDRPTIVYDPQDPADLVADVRVKPALGYMWLWIAAAMTMVALGVLAWRGRLRWLLDP